MINDKHVIWVRNPKCAGTSVKMALARPNDYSIDDTCIHKVPKIKSGKYYSEIITKGKVVSVNASHLDNFRSVNKHAFQNGFKFTISRNPFDRFISGWRYCKSTKHKDINDLIGNLPKKRSQEHDWYHLSRPQTQGLVVNKKLNFDFVIRFEHLQKDFDKLKALLNIDEEIKLPHVRVSKHRHYSEYYKDNQKLIDFVVKVYKKDFELFGYDEKIV